MGGDLGRGVVFSFGGLVWWLVSVGLSFRESRCVLGLPVGKTKIKKFGKIAYPQLRVCFVINHCSGPSQWRARLRTH